MNSLKILAAVALVAATLGSANASNITWSNNGTTWATGTNWLGGVAPANSLTTDTALFNSTTFTQQPNTGTTSIAGITVGNGTIPPPARSHSRKVGSPSVLVALR